MITLIIITITYNDDIDFIKAFPRNYYVGHNKSVIKILSVPVWESVPGARTDGQLIWLKLGTKLGCDKISQKSLWLTSWAVCSRAWGEVPFVAYVILCFCLFWWSLSSFYAYTRGSAKNVERKFWIIWECLRSLEQVILLKYVLRLRKSSTNIKAERNHRERPFSCSAVCCVFLPIW